MKHFFNRSIEDIEDFLNVNHKQGLSTDEIEERKKKYGLNKLNARKGKSIFSMFIDQFKSFMVVVLLVAAILSGYIGITHGEGLLDTYIIIGILIINAVIGVIQESRAQSSLEALNKMSTPHTKVKRDGEIREVLSEDVVPGDVIVLETGDIIPADIRLFESVNLQVQESSLTGESVPQEKSIETINKDDIPLGDRKNMVFSTGMVTYGRGSGLVVSTGMDTEVGKIAEMLQNTEDTDTPMKIRLEKLGKTLGIAAIVICAIIFVIGILYGNNILDTFMMAISLAVAAIPEGLQVISTIVLAMGVQRLVKHNAIVRTLPSVESLGSATVICSDKTGTLTQNKMTVVEGWTYNNLIDYSQKKREQSDNNNSTNKKLIQSALLCTDAQIVEEKGEKKQIGDPTETAIVNLALDLGIHKNHFENKHERVAEIPFESDRKRMTTINKMEDNQLQAHVKGGLDEIIQVTSKILKNGKVVELSKEDINEINNQNERMASSALRVLAIAYKDIDSLPENITPENIENNLIFIGLIGMIDPARPEVIKAVSKCRTAGIRPVMITGDHKITAMAIAKEIGIFTEGDKAITGVELNRISDEQLQRDVKKYSVYARVAPEHKVKIVKAWQSHQEVVAMTGDGVNDAPALKQADIGTSMGLVGTEVAKDASDVILTDDNFATIVSAIEEGRKIYDNILKSIQFLLSSNVGEVLLIFIASIFNLGNPLLPIHILWINLVTDSLPALALSVDPAEDNIMTRKPRDSKKGIFSKGMIWRIIYQGIVIGLISLLAYNIGKNDGGIILGQTMSFAVLAFSQLFHVRNLHSNHISSFKMSILRNKALIGSILLSMAMMLIILLIPSIRDAFKLVEMDTIHWLIVFGLSLTPIFVVELFKLLGINSTKDEY